MIKIEIVKDAGAAAKVAATHYKSLLNDKANAVLGLATGSTPIPLYKELLELHSENAIDFSQSICFNLDEYCDLPNTHRESYANFMYEQFYHLANVEENNRHIPDGNAHDLEKECERYNDLLSQHGPIDLQLLGIGRNGHIGFNEPNTELKAGTHIVKLSEATVKDNSRFFEEEEEVPAFAISVGMKSILSSKKIILLAIGEEKAKIVHALMHSGITTLLPASFLHIHTNVTLICDEAAASLL